MSAGCIMEYASGSSLVWAMDGHIMCHSIISSCQSGATSEIVKHFLVTSLAHVSSAISTIGLYISTCVGV